MRDESRIAQVNHHAPITRIMTIAANSELWSVFEPGA